MRRFLGTIGLLVALVLPGAAMAQPAFDDPTRLIEYAYAPYETGKFPDDPTELFSATLKQLWDEMVARSAEAEMPIIDFDPFIDAQDYEIADLLIADPVIEGDTAVVAVSFVNFGETRELRFSLVRRSGSWWIDDIESIDEDFGWRLSELLAADPLLN